MHRFICLLLVCAGIANADTVTAFATAECNDVIEQFHCVARGPETDNGLLYFAEAESGYGYTLSTDRLAFQAFAFGAASVDSDIENQSGVQALGSGSAEFSFRSWGPERSGVLDYSGGASGDGGPASGFSSEFRINNISRACDVRVTCSAIGTAPITLGTVFFVSVAGFGSAASAGGARRSPS
jgi:hypothetical protein